MRTGLVRPRAMEEQEDRKGNGVCNAVEGDTFGEAEWANVEEQESEGRRRGKPRRESSFRPRR